jgi:hypothetical protein
MTIGCSESMRTLSQRRSPRRIFLEVSKHCEVNQGNTNLGCSEVKHKTNTREAPITHDDEKNERMETWK